VKIHCNRKYNRFVFWSTRYFVQYYS